MTIAGPMAEQRRQWAAQWCWAGHALHPWNQYVLFRRPVDLPAAPRRAVVRVSADALYTLFVNGTRVHHGPARCFPGHQSYDTLDLTGLLQPGPNVVAAVCHQFGTTTFQRTYRGASGFLLDGVIELEGDADRSPCTRRPGGRPGRRRSGGGTRPGCRSSWGSRSTSTPTPPVGWLTAGPADGKPDRGRTGKRTRTKTRPTTPTGGSRPRRPGRSGPTRGC